MKQFKVWGGLTFLRGNQVRTIIATKTKKQASEILGISMYELNTYWCETGNKIELKVALGKPFVVFMASGSMEKDFNELHNKDRWTK